MVFFCTLERIIATYANFNAIGFKSTTFLRILYIRTRAYLENLTLNFLFFESNIDLHSKIVNEITYIILENDELQVPGNYHFMP